MGNFYSCSMFNVLGNGTMEQNCFRGTSHGTLCGTDSQKSLFLKGLRGSLMEHRMEHPWNKAQKRVPRALHAWNKKVRFNKKENNHGL